MATIKLTIDQRRTYSDSRHPVVFRLTSKTRSTTIDANIKLLPQEWDSIKGKVNKSHPKSKILNVYLHNKLLEMEMKLVEYAHKVDKLSVLELKELVVKGDVAEQIPLKQFAEKEINSLKQQQRYGNAQSYQTAVNRFLKFAGEDVFLSKIDYTLICAFDSQLMKEGLSRNSVSVYMRKMRALLNIAIKKGVLDRKHYPFNSYRIKVIIHLLMKGCYK